MLFSISSWTRILKMSLNFYYLILFDVFWLLNRWTFTLITIYFGVRNSNIEVDFSFILFCSHTIAPVVSCPSISVTIILFCGSFCMLVICCFVIMYVFILLLPLLLFLNCFSVNNLPISEVGVRLYPP